VLGDDDPLSILDSLQVIGQMFFQGLDTDFRHSASSLPEETTTSAAGLGSRRRHAVILRTSSASWKDLGAGKVLAMVPRASDLWVGEPSRRDKGRQPRVLTHALTHISFGAWGKRSAVAPSGLGTLVGPFPGAHAPGSTLSPLRG